MRWVTLVGLAAMCAGCAGGGLGVEARAVTAEKPGRVAAYLSVSGGEEVASGLTAADFTIYEDGSALSAERTGQLLLDKSRVATHHTLVLLDLSDATDPAVKDELRNSVWFFVDRVEETQSVSVYGYDGGENIRLIADFPRQAKPRALPSAERLPLPKGDRSRNLHGALIAAEKALEQKLTARGRPLGFGTLVVFAAGPDLAGRVSAGEAHDALGASRHRVLGVSYGDGAGAIHSFAKDGYFDAHDAPLVSLAFEDAAHRVEALYAEEYLLAYCSPARAGIRQLRIEARVVTETGERTGSAYGEFDAEGFSSPCDPAVPPRFDEKSLR